MNVKTSFGILLCMALTSAGFAQTDTGAQTVEKGYTQPSYRKELAFSFQGIIAKVDVKEGDRVKAGAELMKQDDRMEEKRLQGLRLQADQTLLVKAKQATLENKKVEAKRVEGNYQKGAATESEMLQAKLDVTLAQAEVELAQHDQVVKTADADLQEVHVKLLSLKSPMDGIVEKIVQGEGEVANIDKPSIVVVKNDPLYIELKTMPVATVQKLKVGDTLDVRYPGEDAWQKATINFIAPVANAGAGTQAIRLEMPNPEHRSTGLAIDVKIPGASVADAR